MSSLDSIFPSAGQNETQVTAEAYAEILPQVVVLKLVFDGDIIVLALFALFVVLALPRTFVRLFCANILGQGHILWYTSARTLARRRQRQHPSAPGFSADSDKSSDSQSQDSHTLTDHYPASLASARAPRYPAHVRALASYPWLTRVADVLARRMQPGYSVGQFLITQGYSTVFQTLLTLHSNPFTDPGRAGLLASAQIPLVFAFAAKNNLLGWMVGVGYEKVRLAALSVCLRAG